MTDNAPPPHCDWIDDDSADGAWATSCGHLFVLTDGGTPAQNRMAFCCYCGKPLTSENEAA